MRLGTDEPDRWVGDILGTLRASRLVLDSNIVSKPRIALILVDNAVLITLKTYLKARTQEKKQSFENADFPVVVGLVKKNVGSLVEDQKWVRIKHLTT